MNDWANDTVTVNGRNPAPPKGWLKHVETLQIVEFCPPSTGASDFATIHSSNSNINYDIVTMEIMGELLATMKHNEMKP